MSIASPLSALASAILPVLAGISFGERLSMSAIVGIVLALVAVLLVSREHEETPHPVSTRVVVMSLLSGVFIAGFFIALQRSPADSGLWPLLTSRGMAAVILGSAALSIGRARWPGRQVGLLATASSALDVVATAAFLLATREGLLAIVAVITALYPAATLLMARMVLGERLQRIQLVGLGLAATSVTILAVGSQVAG